MSYEFFQRTIIPFLDGTIVFFVIYEILKIIKGTRAVPMLLGLAGILFLYVISKDNFLGLYAFNWLLEQVIGSFFIIVIILFQSDIRRAFTTFGSHWGFRTHFKKQDDASMSQTIDELVKASQQLAEKRIGALILIERDGDLTPYLQEAIKIDAKICHELLYTIFIAECQNPLHDGATVIRNNRIHSSAVFLPMSVNPDIALMYGTRHRAALGISEETDAVVLVVSEERGQVSIAHSGKLEGCATPNDVRQKLSELLIQSTAPVIRHGTISIFDGLFSGNSDEPNKKKKKKKKKTTQETLPATQSVMRTRESQPAIKLSSITRTRESQPAIKISQVKIETITKEIPSDASKDSTDHEPKA